MKTMAKLKGNPYYSKINTPEPGGKRKNATGRTFEFPPAYVIILGIEGEELEKAKALGLTVRPAQDGKLATVSFNSKVTDEAHKDLVASKGQSGDGRRPRTYDENGKELGRFPVVGSESEVSVIFSIWDNDGTATPLIRAIQIHKLVLPEGFTEMSGDDFESEIEINDTDVESKVNTEVDDLDMSSALDDL
jgi:hypothetical protein